MGENVTTEATANHRGIAPGWRSIRLAADPTHAIVLSSALAIDRFEPVLAQLVPECKARSIELAVVRATSDDEFSRLQEAWPWAIWIPARDGFSVAQMRGVAVAAVGGDIVHLASDARHEELMGLIEQMGRRERS